MNDQTREFLTNTSDALFDMGQIVHAAVVEDTYQVPLNTGAMVEKFTIALNHARTAFDLFVTEYDAHRAPPPPLVYFDKDPTSIKGIENPDPVMRRVAELAQAMLPDHFLPMTGETSWDQGDQDAEDWDERMYRAWRTSLSSGAPIGPAVSDWIASGRGSQYQE